MAERDRLLSDCRDFTSTEGSNPSLPADRFISLRSSFIISQLFQNPETREFQLDRFIFGHGIC